MSYEGAYTKEEIAGLRARYERQEDYHDEECVYRRHCDCDIIGESDRFLLTIEQLGDEIARKDEALRFYADIGNYSEELFDSQKFLNTARAALEPPPTDTTP